MKSRKGLIAALARRRDRRRDRPDRLRRRSGTSGYVVRAIFDNGSFMVKGEQVRVAGANVGEVESVGVTMPGEIDSYENGHPEAIPGKAVIVMKIEDPGFQDFRQDANCIIRPQSLIGEKYVDCRPTLPRAPGTDAAAAAAHDQVRPARRRPAPAAAREQQHQRRPRPDQRHPHAALRAALPPDLQRTRRRPGRPRLRHRGRGQTRQPGPPRRRPGARNPLRPARPTRPARLRLRADPAAALRPAHPRRRLPRQRRRRRPGDRRTRRRTGSLAAEVPPLPARVPGDDAQPQGLLRRGDAGPRQPRPGDAGADRSDPAPGALHHAPRPWR